MHLNTESRACQNKKVTNNSRKCPGTRLPSSYERIDKDFIA